MKFKEFMKQPVTIVVTTALVVSLVMGGVFIGFSRNSNEEDVKETVLIEQDTSTFNEECPPNVEETYNVIANNVRLTANEFIDIELYKDEECVIIHYKIDDEYTAFIEEQGFTQADCDVNAKNMVQVYDVIQSAFNQLGKEQGCPIYMALSDQNSNYFLIIKDGKVIESNTLMGKSTASDNKSDAKNNTKKATCIYCNGPLKDTDKKSVCSTCKDDPMAQSNGKHMESTAPYGRCPKCNAANASDKGYQGNYCDDCFGQIKEEEYKEKHKYGDCVDCGVYLTQNQANSYGGRCPDCYAKHYGDNDTHMGSCERCGDRVDMDHTNDGWGYNHLCSACTGELQMQESMEDYSPYAG